MTSRRTYSVESLQPLRDEGARRFLKEVGLPVEHLLFEVTEPALEAGTGGRRLLRVGLGGDVEAYCVDVDSGEVVVVTLADHSIWHVNASPEKFARCLDEFAVRFPYGNGEEDLSDRELMASALRDALTEIDDTAFDEDQGFWDTLVGDVAIGDYAEA